MNQTDNVSNLITSDVSFGIPTCKCGHCVDELMEPGSDQIVITQEALNAWLQKSCPAEEAA